MHPLAAEVGLEVPTVIVSGFWRKRRRETCLDKPSPLVRVLFLAVEF